MKNVIIVEGEAKADLLNSWGLVATCLDSGANSPWKDAYIPYFKGKQVVIFPDNDEPGNAYACKIATALHGKVKELKIIKLPGLGEAEDVIDWSRIDGNTKEKLIEIVKNTSVWTPKECDKNNSTMILTRLDSLFQEPEENVTWLVDGLLPSGGFAILVAKPKVGKTETAKNLAYNIASNNLFLGRSVNPGAVIYLALEEKRSEIKKHFRAMGATGNEEIYIYAGGAPVDAIKQITSVVESLKPVLLIIDPLFRLVKLKDGNDYVQVTNALEPLLRLARDSGTHVLCVHHSPKGERNAEDSPLGSQAIFGSVDTLMIMKRYEGYRTIQTIQRYGSDMEEIVLEYNPETRSITVGGTKQEQDICWVEEAIIDFLSKQTEPVTEKVINDEVEGRTALKRKALRELIKQGEIVRSGRGGKGDPYRYSCSLESVCSELGNESGNNQKNDQEKDSCSLVPDVWREQQKKIVKTTEEPARLLENACSQFPLNRKVDREHANSTKKEGEIEQKNFEELCEFFEQKKIETN